VTGIGTAATATNSGRTLIGSKTIWIARGGTCIAKPRRSRAARRDAHRVGLAAKPAPPKDARRIVAHPATSTRRTTRCCSVRCACATAIAPARSPRMGSRSHVAICRINSMSSSTNRDAAIARNFATHLAIEFPAVFTFLLEPDAIDATNWRAEHALRPAVVTRKVCGGNRSARGAHTQEVLASVLRTIHQRNLEADVILSQLLRSRQPTIALAPPPAVRRITR
jgi:transposase